MLIWSIERVEHGECMSSSNGGMMQTLNQLSISLSSCYNIYSAESATWISCPLARENERVQCTELWCCASSTQIPQSNACPYNILFSMLRTDVAVDNYLQASRRREPLLPEKKPLIGRDRPLHKLSNSGTSNAKLSSSTSNVKLSGATLSYIRTSSGESLVNAKPTVAVTLQSSNSAIEAPT